MELSGPVTSLTTNIAQARVRSNALRTCCNTVVRWGAHASSDTLSPGPAQPSNNGWYAEAFAKQKDAHSLPTLRWIPRNGADRGVSRRAKTEARRSTAWDQRSRTCKGLLTVFMGTGNGPGLE